MKDDKLKKVSIPEKKTSDPLTELLRQGARDLIKNAVETELETMLTEYSNLKLTDGRQAIVRNGYLPERTIQTGIGDVNVKVLRYVIEVDQEFISIANCYRLICHTPDLTITPISRCSYES